MTNAKRELIDVVIRYSSNIKCATIWRGNGYEDPPVEERINLFLGHEEKDFEKFLEALDFDYDSGFGGQELFGRVWLDDGSWLTRGEYDGSEWWEYHKLPEIPNDLILIKKEQIK